MKHNSRGDDSLIFDHSNDDTACLKKLVGLGTELKQHYIVQGFKSKVYKGWARKYCPLVEVGYVRKQKNQGKITTIHTTPPK